MRKEFIIMEKLHNQTQKLIAFFLSLVLLVGFVPQLSKAKASFFDVDETAWYAPAPMRYAMRFFT